jgi:hypothetical protein
MIWTWHRIFRRDKLVAEKTETVFQRAIPVLPAGDVSESLKWWTEICGFRETFRDGTPPNYAGIQRGEARAHICGMSDKELARTVGDQTMVRFLVNGIEALYAEYRRRGGQVHPNGPLQTKPWGTREFAAIDPNGVCVTFQE